MELLTQFMHIHLQKGDMYNHILWICSKICTVLSEIHAIRNVLMQLLYLVVWMVVSWDSN